MHPSYAHRWNFGPQDEPYVRAFEHYTRAQGWTRAEVEKAYDWYAAHFNKANAQPMDPESLMADFEQYALAKNFSVDQIRGVRDFRAGIAEHGPAPFLPQVTRRDDAERARYIEKLIKNSSDEYFASPELKAEYTEILERLAGPDPDNMPPPTPEPVATGEGSTLAKLNLAGTSEPSFKEKRLAEFEAMTRDPNGDYYHGRNSQALKDEFLTLLGGEPVRAEPKLHIGKLEADAPRPPGTVIESECTPNKRNSDVPLTKADAKIAIQEIRGEEFHSFLKSRRPARQAELEGERLARDRLVPAGQAAMQWTVTLASADQYPKMFEPSFWAGAGDKLKIGDTLEIRDDLLTLYATAIVVVADQARAFVELRELFKKELAPATVDETIVEGFETKYEGLSKRWCVYRKQDGHCMRTQLPSKHDAMEYVRTDLRPIKG
jgi:hypothetical protein